VLVRTAGEEKLEYVVFSNLPGLDTNFDSARMPEKSRQDFNYLPQVRIPTFRRCTVSTTSLHPNSKLRQITAQKPNFNTTPLMKLNSWIPNYGATTPRLFLVSKPN